VATILAGWELGMGMWHVAALREVARQLRDRGHTVVFALSNIVGPYQLLDGEGFEVLQAPVCPPQPMDVAVAEQGADTFADILAGTGFAGVHLLLPLVRGWQALIERVKPDLVVCDHSPALRVACYGALPVVGLGIGFTSPPTQLNHLPPIKSGGDGGAPGANEVRVLEVVQEVQRRRGRSAPSTLPSLFAGEGEFICAFPEFDPYARFQPRPYAGTLGGWSAPLPMPDQPRFYAYLAADHEGLDSIVQGLVRSGIAGSFDIKGAPEALRSELARRGVTLPERLSPLRETLPQTTVIIHHGGVGMSQHAGSAGRPQLVFPRHLEQLWNGTALEVLGVGQMLRGAPDAMTVAKAVRRLARDPAPLAAAARWASEIAGRGHGDPVGAIVRRCEARLASGLTGDS